MFEIFALILIILVSIWSLYVYHDQSITNYGRNKIIGVCLIFTIGMLMDMAGSAIISTIGLAIAGIDVIPLLWLFKKYFYSPIQK